LLPITMLMLVAMNPRLNSARSVPPTGHSGSRRPDL